MSLVEDLKADFNKPVPKDFKQKYVAYIGSGMVKYQKVAEIINLTLIVYLVATGGYTFALILLALWWYVVANQIYHILRGK